MSRLWPSALTALILTSLAATLPSAVAAAVDWPPSAGLVVGEVVTGGPTAADEFLELYNRGDSAAPLTDIEVVYVTSTGGTVTRKQRWLQGVLPPGERLLIANVDGVYAADADHTYSGGLSAAGGSIVVRVVGGDVIDTLSWGTAASAFVEGTPGTAPEAGSSIERRPGGGGGNGRDTNDNAADTIINSSPLAQGSKPTPKPRQRQARRRQARRSASLDRCRWDRS